MAHVTAKNFVKWFYLTDVYIEDSLLDKWIFLNMNFKSFHKDGLGKYTYKKVIDGRDIPFDIKQFTQQMIERGFSVDVREAYSRYYEGYGHKNERWDEVTITLANVSSLMRGIESEVRADFSFKNKGGINVVRSHDNDTLNNTLTRQGL